MDFVELIAAAREQGAALRESVVKAGPDVPVLTCPDWRVHDLVAHLGGVHDFVLQAVTGDPRTPPSFTTSSGTWAEVLSRWDRTFETLLERFSTADPQTPTWAPPDMPAVVRTWTRRVAHETAIHRLDADSTVRDLPTLVFGTELAADGIDEFLGTMLPTFGREITITGTALFHAADAGRAWQVTLEAGQPLVVTKPTGSGVDANVSVVGTADAVYRAVWGRPSTAVVSGDRELLGVLAPP